MARDVYEDKEEAAAAPRSDGLGSALVIVTTLVLLLAFVFMQQALKKHFNAGMFADKQQAAPPA
jgi:hypothetical protein